MGSFCPGPSGSVRSRAAAATARRPGSVYIRRARSPRSRRARRSGAPRSAIVERAGGRSPTCRAYTSFIAAKSPRSMQEDRRLDELVEPASRRFEDRAHVRHDLLGLLRDAGAGELPVSRLIPSWPATKTRSPTRIAWLYGAPWNGPGARSVRMTSFSAMRAPSLSFGAGARERDAERLEDRGQDVLRVLALDQANVDREPGGLGELVGGTPRRDRSGGRRPAST